MSSSTQTRRHLSSKRDHSTGRIPTKNLISMLLNIQPNKEIEAPSSKDTPDQVNKVVSRCRRSMKVIRILIKLKSFLKALRKQRR
jgi:hypothetical protein